MRSGPDRIISIAECHMAENQVAFRRTNQLMLRSWDQLRSIAKEDEQEYLVAMPKGYFYFKCECADMNCKRRVKLGIQTYNKIHKNPRCFCVAHGHIMDSIEQLVESHRYYDVVRKYHTPRQDADKFWPTRAHFE